jgi:hypothetical protein
LLAEVRKVCVEGGLVVEFEAFQRAHSRVTGNVLELMGIRHLADIPPAEEKLVSDAPALSLDALFEKARHKARATSIFKFREKRNAWAISEILKRAFVNMKPNLMVIQNSRGLLEAGRRP